MRKKRMTRTVILSITALLLCIILVLSNISLLNIPKSIDYKIDEVRATWSRGNGPTVDGVDIDYSYFSPIDNGAPTDKKYPIIVIMAGALEGLQEGFELVANVMPIWTTPDYQARFKEGGAYLFIARAPEEDWKYWDSSKLTPCLKAAIDDFCTQNPNADTERLHIIGWCLGGNGAINLAASYPNEFSSATIMCPDRAISKNEALALKNMPVWFMGSETDTYSSYKRTVLKSYKRLCAVSSRKDDIRITAYSSAPDVPLLEKIPFIFNHNLWNNLSMDMPTNEQEYPDMRTVDGNGKTIENSSAISWLDSKTIADGRDKSDARETNSFDYKLHFFFQETLKVFFKERLMKLMLNTFTLLGLI